MYMPTEAARLVGCSASTVRSYGKLFAAVTYPVARRPSLRWTSCPCWKPKRMKESELAQRIAITIARMWNKFHILAEKVARLVMLSQKLPAQIPATRIIAWIGGA